jgi:NADPH:quinone reductase
MKAVYITRPGGPEVLEIREVPDPPAPQGSEVLVRVRASGLNRADLLQRRGLYPAPAGHSQNVPGLEFAGEIVECGGDVRGWEPADRVFGIGGGDAQAEYLIADQRLLAPIPAAMGFADAAAVPEAFVTAGDAVILQAGLSESEWLLVHAVGSGVGLAALQLAKERGARVIGTSRTPEKIERCGAMGMDLGILVRGGADFSRAVLDSTGGRGVDVVLDLVGGAYFPASVKSLAPKGRLMVVGLTAGRTAEIDLGQVLSGRLKVIGTMLRGRSLEEKASATKWFSENVVPLLEAGKVRPVVDRVFPFAEAAAAHSYLESNETFGEGVLEF